MVTDNRSWQWIASSNPCWVPFPLSTRSHRPPERRYRAFQSLLGSLPSFNETLKVGYEDRVKVPIPAGFPSLFQLCIKGSMEKGPTGSNPCWVPFPLSTAVDSARSSRRSWFQSLLGSLPSFNTGKLDRLQCNRHGSNPCWVPFPLSTLTGKDADVATDEVPIPAGFPSLFQHQRSRESGKVTELFQSLLGSLPSFNGLPPLQRLDSRIVPIPAGFPSLFQLISPRSIPSHRTVPIPAGFPSLFQHIPPPPCTLA